MASAPRIVTRKAAGPFGAPPAPAASAPSAARQAMDAPVTVQINGPVGVSAATARGKGRAARETGRRRHGRLHRTGAVVQQDAQLIARMRVQRVMMRQLAGDLRRQVRRQPALHIDLGQFGQFLAGIALERALFKPQVGRLGIGLRTH